MKARRLSVILPALALAAALVARADNAGPASVAPLLFDFEKGNADWVSATEGVAARVASAAKGRGGQALEVGFNGKETGVCLRKSLDLSKFRAVQFDTLLPSHRADMRVLLYFIDEDDFWYQSWLRIAPEQGKWTHVEVDIRPKSGLFLPMGHSRPWSLYPAREVKEVGIRVFADRPVSGVVSFDDITFAPGAEELPPQAVLNFETSPGDVPRFTMFEVTFELSRTYDNPFDPDQIQVSALFQSASGKRVTVDGFFFQDFERRRDKRVESLIAVGAPKWKIRFSPPEVGEWSYEIAIKDSEELRLAPRKFTCVPSELHGRVQLSSDKRYFEFEDGSFFYPIGHNIPAAFNEKAAVALGLTIERREGTLAFDRYLAGMQKAGENYARIWLAVWSFGLEWSRKYHPNYRGVGRYNLQNAWRLDYVMRQAEERGIFVQLALSAFGQWRLDRHEGDWPFSPYNVVNGGWLRQPQQFWSDERAQASYQRMVRYVMARWGYSSHIAAWEVCNEVDLVTGYNDHVAEIVAWHTRCAETIRQYDQWNRLVTCTFCYVTNYPSLLSQPAISFSSTNPYAIQVIDKMRQVFQQQTAFGKPVIMTECGYDVKGASIETTEKYLHVGLWASYMMPFAGAGMSWWWDFLDDRDLYRMFTPLVEFARGEDLRRRNLQMSSAECLAADGKPAGGLAVLTLQNDTSGYFWMYETQLLRAESEALFAPAPRKEIQVSFRGLKEGEYRVEFWDTVKGGKVQELTARAGGDGRLCCSVPEFTGDVAGKVRPL